MIQKNFDSIDNTDIDLDVIAHEPNLLVDEALDFVNAIEDSLDLHRPKPPA